MLGNSSQNRFWCSTMSTVTVNKSHINAALAENKRITGKPATYDVVYDIEVSIDLDQDNRNYLRIKSGINN